MGVHGLWQLVKPTGRPVTLESLEGKVLAVDISIWLHQAVRGMRDADGNLVNNAHLVTLLHRICKLLYFRIKPIFVFDGSVPELKRRTMASRRKRKEFALDKSGQASEQILRNYMKVHAVDEVLGKKKGLKKPKIAKVNNKVNDGSNMYILPPLPETTEETFRKEEDDLWNEHQGHRSWVTEHYQEIDNMDIQSDMFKDLPPEIQYELIEEYLEKNKHNSWAKKSILPKEANEFSDFQLGKLLNKNKLNQRLEDIRTEMNNRSSGAIANLLDIETRSIEARRIDSEDTQHYILVKTQKQKLSQDTHDELKPSGSKDCLDNVSNNSKSLSNDTIDLTIDKESKQLITTNDLEMALQDIFNKQRDMLKQYSSSGYNTDIPDDHLVSSEDLMSKKSENEVLLTDTDLTDKGISASSNVDNKDLTIEDVHNKEEGKVIASVMPSTITPDKILEFDQSNVTFKSVASGIKDVITVTKEVTSKQIKDADQIESDNNIESVAPSNIHHRENTREVIKSVENTAVCYEPFGLQQDKQEEGKVTNNLTSSENDRGIESDGDSHSEDDFIEVAFDPKDARGNDELFPAEIFMQINSNVQQPNNSDQVTEVQQKEEELMEAMSKQREKSIQEWKEMNTSDVSDLENALAQERAMLQNERQRQQRIGASITDQMYADCKELLELFGIPYVVSPQEAEAQCAYFDICQQTDGSITDDSDIWLFGGCRVYKNFFTKDKDVEFYESRHFESQLFLDRMKLVCMAILLGCDYTDGIDGVGYITAMEILSEFPDHGINGLKEFRRWWDANAGNLNPPVETKIKSQLRKLNLPSKFPQEEVIKAFMNPQVEESMEEFTWGLPDLDSIRGFALERLNWNRKKTDENVLPVLKKLNEKNVQRPITSYFGHVAGQNTTIQSKRLKRVLKKIQQSPSESDKEEKVTINSKDKRKANVTKKKACQGKRKAADDVKEDAIRKKIIQTEEGGIKKSSGNKKRRAKVVRYTCESDEISSQSKIASLNWKGPNLSESGTSSDSN